MEKIDIKRCIVNSSGIFLCEDEVNKVFQSQQKEIDENRFRKG